VGGGLGTVPQQAKLMSDFVPEEDLLPLSQAISIAQWTTVPFAYAVARRKSLVLTRSAILLDTLD
jgi:sulfite reductase beta subunit-like hemoprotein